MTTKSQQRLFEVFAGRFCHVAVWRKQFNNTMETNYLRSSDFFCADSNFPPEIYVVVESP